MKTKKVLVVDDNNTILKLMENSLDKKKFQTYTKSDVNNIIKKIQTVNPDIILLDIKLRSSSGIEAIKIIKEKEVTKNIPIVAFTSYAMKGDRERFLNMGFDGYISKPINTRTIELQIQEVLNLKNKS